MLPMYRWLRVYFTSFRVSHRGQIEIRTPFEQSSFHATNKTLQLLITVNHQPPVIFRVQLETDCFSASFISFSPSAANLFAILEQRSFSIPFRIIPQFLFYKIQRISKHAKIHDTSRNSYMPDQLKFALISWSDPQSSNRPRWQINECQYHERILFCPKSTRKQDVKHQNPILHRNFREHETNFSPIIHRKKLQALQETSQNNKKSNRLSFQRKLCLAHDDVTVTKMFNHAYSSSLGHASCYFFPWVGVLFHFFAARYVSTARTVPVSRKYKLSFFAIGIPFLCKLFSEKCRN